MSRIEYLKLSHHAVAIPAAEHRKFQPVVLAAGSIVTRPKRDSAASRATPELTDWAGEELVEFVHMPGGELLVGHVAKGTVLVVAPRAREHVSIQWQPADGSQLTVVDLLRLRVALAKMDTVAYLSQRRSPAHLALYSAIVRERGGNVKRTDDADTITERLARMILTPEGISMARKSAVVETEEQDEEIEEQEEEATPRKRASKKAAAKKGAQKRADNAGDGEGRTPMGVSLGKALVPLLREAGVKGEALKSAKALEAGETLKKPQLIALRDSVNEAAAAAREEENTKLASQLSGANRVVRRLSRV